MPPKSDENEAAAQQKRPALKLPNVEPQLIAYILDEVVVDKPQVKFDDIGKFFCYNIMKIALSNRTIYYWAISIFHGDMKREILLDLWKTNKLVFENI